MHLLITHNEILRQIAICKDDYKFDAYPHSILKKFTVDDEVMVMIHFERFHPETVRKLHTRHTNSYKILRRITVITHELDIKWDSDISLIFSGRRFDSF